VTFGAEVVGDVLRMEEWLDEFGHGRLVSELTGVTFNGAKTGILDNAVGQRGFADTWWAVQKDSGWAPWSAALNPG
jgi:hypothetical protein